MIPIEDATALHPAITTDLLTVMYRYGRLRARLDTRHHIAYVDGKRVREIAQRIRGGERAYFLDQARRCQRNQCSHPSHLLP